MSARILEFPSIPTPSMQPIGELRMDINGQVWASSESHGWINLTTPPGDVIETADDCAAPTISKGI